MARRVLTISELPELFERVASVHSTVVKIGVVDQETAQYARVLEYGSVADEKPWPSAGERTILAADPETGTQVVVSARAPEGFIRVSTPGILREMVSGIPGAKDWLDLEALESHLEQRTAAFGETSLKRIQSVVPRDSGRLRDSLRILRE